MANTLYKETKNKVFKNVTPEEFSAVFKQTLDDEKSKLANGDLVAAHYEQNDYDPDFVMDHLWNKDLVAMADRFGAAADHGLDPKLFNASEIKALIAKFQDKKAIKTKDEAYKDMAELEIMSANSLITYSRALQYGLIDPKKIYKRYFTKTLNPDTASITHVFDVTNLKNYLDSIQPKAAQYLALQKALKTDTTAPGFSKEETKRLIQVNLERLRWKNKPSEDKYVVVNIPDFHLDVMEKGSPVLSMKVCVGGGRNKDYKNTLAAYNDTCKVDKPNPHETPMLNSLIHSVEVNPVWNIPQSIASKEILVDAAKDPYYLSSKNIDVYKNGKKVEDPESIDWASVSKTNNDYEFKQKPGADNSLGKIKFLFNNKSSVYLHDTPAQAPFGYDMRAVSHGCVRLEKPLELAHALFTDSAKYNFIANVMSKDNPTPTDISLRPKTAVYITYVTCWADQTGNIQFRKDVYGLDIVLYDKMQKYLPTE